MTRSSSWRFCLEISTSCLTAADASGWSLISVLTSCSARLRVSSATPEVNIASLRISSSTSAPIPNGVPRRVIRANLYSPEDVVPHSDLGRQPHPPLSDRDDRADSAQRAELLVRAGVRGRHRGKRLFLRQRAHSLPAQRVPGGRRSRPGGGAHPLAGPC